MLWKKKGSYKGFEGSNPYNSLSRDEQENVGEIVTNCNMIKVQKMKKKNFKTLKSFMLCISMRMVL